MNRSVGIALICITLLFTGCSTMSKKDCLNADWYGSGLQDGRMGYPSNRISTYVASCDKHDVAVNKTEYMRGHEEGIRSYCQPDNGYQIGLKGRALPNVCPADLSRAFAREHEKGYTKFKINRDIDQAKQTIAGIGKNIVTLEDGLIEATAELYAATTNDTKAQAQNKVNSVNSQLAAETQKKVNATGKLACASANWYTAGLSDAKEGRAASTYSNHMRQCSAYHPPGNKAHYNQGHREGLAQYCTYDSGFLVGSRGQTVSSICSGAAKRDMDAGYRQGLKKYDEKLTIVSLKIKKSQLEKLIPKLENEKKNTQIEQNNPDLSSAQKLELARKLNRVSRDLMVSQNGLLDTTNELNCYVADWQAFGFEEGEQGNVLNNTSRHCRSFGISVDEKQFEIGYQLGLNNYCTEPSGQIMGAAGKEYMGVCPGRLETEFLKGYIPAFNEYQRKRLRKELSLDLKTLSQQLKTVQKDVDLLTSDLDQTNLTRSERLKIINDIAALNRKEQALSNDNNKVRSHYECLTDSWHNLGKEHGAAGRDNQLRVMNCNRFSITPNSAQYRNGLSRGLLSWCTWENGHQAALNATATKFACSRTEHREFYRGYDAGLTEVANQAKINALKVEKLDIIEGLPPLRNRLAVLETKLQDPNLSSRERKTLTREQLSIQRKILTREIRLDEIEEALVLLNS